MTEIEKAHQRRIRRVVEARSVTECDVDGRRCLSFASNDYLGLTRHPKVLQAFSDAATRQAGSGSSPLISGRSPQQAALEKHLADFEGSDACVVFSSGFSANVGTLNAIISDGDAVFCERDNHASLIDGCRTSAGRFLVFDRSDLAALQSSLRRRRSDYDAVFLVIDAVFSMDGSVAPLTELCDIAEEFDAHLVVDEAHGTGVFGTHGRGVCEWQNVEHRVAVRIGTLSKAIGGLGGFVAGSNILCDWLWNRARSQFFSTALPPAVCAAASAALQVLRDEPERRERLGKNSRLFRELLRSNSLEIMAAPEESPIVAVLPGRDEIAVSVSGMMLDRGIFAPAVRPPTVAPGTARLRFSVTCEHSETQMERAVYQLRDVLKSTC